MEVYLIVCVDDEEFPEPVMVGHCDDPAMVRTVVNDLLSREREVIRQVLEERGQKEFARVRKIEEVLFRTLEGKPLTDLDKGENEEAHEEMLEEKEDEEGEEDEKS